MSRIVHDIADHAEHLPKSRKAFVEQISDVVKNHGLRRVALWPKDYDALIEELRGKGFDVGRGFNIGGARAIRHAEKAAA